MCALEKKLQFRDLFCWPFRKDWLLSFWPTGGPSLWCTDGLNWVDDFGAGFLGILEVTSETPVYSMLISHGEDFLVKLLRLQANRLCAWNGAVLALAICSSCSCSCPKAMSLRINWRLDAAAVAEAMDFCEDLCIILTCSCTTLSLASSRMYYKTDTTN